MFLNSVMSEGLAGLQQSQKKMLASAQEIARGGRPTDAPVYNPSATGAAPQSNAGTAVNDLNAVNTVEAGSPVAKNGGAYPSTAGDLTEPLLEQNKQQLIFDASAKVVQTANTALGRLIDDLS